MRAYAITFWPEPALGRPDWPRDAENKKADVVEAPKAFDHVGLLVNKPPGSAGLLFIQSSDNVTGKPR